MGLANECLNFQGKTLPQVLMEVERQYFVWALNRADGNKAEAARLSGVTYQTFTRKLAGLKLRVTYHAE